MNHTAHCWLSWPDPDLLIGNFIGDYVKGRRWEDYPEPISKGILLHRAIDSFTDTHPIPRDSARRIRPWAGRFSAPVVDILYDHLLHLEWPDLSQVPFEQFAEWAYRHIDERSDWMPDVLRQRWPRMLAGRFLHGYAHQEGLDWVLHRFNERLQTDIQPARLSRFFFENIDSFRNDFQVFIPDLAQFVKGETA